MTQKYEEIVNTVLALLDQLPTAEASGKEVAWNYNSILEKVQHMVMRNVMMSTDIQEVIERMDLALADDETGWLGDASSDKHEDTDATRYNKLSDKDQFALASEAWHFMSNPSNTTLEAYCDLWSNDLDECIAEAINKAPWSTEND